MLGVSRSHQKTGAEFQNTPHQTQSDRARRKTRMRSRKVAQPLVIELRRQIGVLGDLICSGLLRPAESTSTSMRLYVRWGECARGFLLVPPKGRYVRFFPGEPGNTNSGWPVSSAELFTTGCC